MDITENNSMVDRVLCERFLFLQPVIRLLAKETAAYCQEIVICLVIIAEETKCFEGFFLYKTKLNIFTDILMSYKIA